MEKKYPPKDGYVIKLTDDRVFRIFMKIKQNRRFLAKIISFTIGIDYEFLVKNMIIVDADIPEDNVINHYNDQDVVVSFNDTTINIEMGNNKYTNKRKNERTASKYHGNQYKMGEKFEDNVYYFYQICIEDYNIFNNDLLITESKIVEVSTGKYEEETDEFRKFHVNLKNIGDVCYNEANKYFKFFTTHKISDLEELVKGDEILMDSLEELKNISRDSVLISELERRELEEYCQKLALLDAKNDGKLEGKLEGMEENKIEIARMMLKDELNVNTISKYTGLSINQINDITFYGNID